MKTISTVIAALALGVAAYTGTAQAQGFGPFSPPQPANGLPLQMAHNGFLMDVRWNSDVKQYEFSYSDPRPSLWGVGVRPGTPLMRGAFQGDQFVAAALMFTRQCGPVPYNVSGNYQNGVLTLFGPEPVIDRWCRVLGNRWDSNSTLVLTPSSTTPQWPVS